MKTQIPHDPATFQQFLDWLEEQGATFITTTNEWEVARYRMPDGARVHVVYATKVKGYSGKRHLSFSDDQSYNHYNSATQ